MNKFRYSCRLFKEIKPGHFVEIISTFSKTCDRSSQMIELTMPPKRRFHRYKTIICGSDGISKTTIYNKNAEPFQPKIPSKYLVPNYK